MGTGLTREKRTQFQREKEDELGAIAYRFNKRENREVILVGPPRSGKEQLLRMLCDKKYKKKYDERETARIGYKLYSTVKSNYKHLHPISFTVTSTPGTFLKHQRASEKYF